MKCPRCQQNNPPQAKFCLDCGAAVGATRPPLRSSPETGAEIEGLRRSLSEAREQQAATSEILKVISSSPADVQPVFETILERAVALCGARHGSLLRFDRQLLHAVAHHDVPSAVQDLIARRFLSPPDWSTAAGRAILTRQAATVEDTLADERYEASAASAGGFRSLLSVPLLRDGDPIGVITIVRSEPGRFSDKQIALLETFAHQAVIAIENVRLFNETKEALEQQTATAEILRVISQSPTDLRPTFDVVAESSARLCLSLDAHVFVRDGDLLRLVGHHGSIPTESTLSLIRGTATGRAVLDGRTVHLLDMQVDADEFPEGSEIARRLGHRTVLIVPLMRNGVAIGAIAARRTEARLFTERQVALLQTFADQAVIAIENVRLFNETKEALEQQTATAEILRVISSSPTSLQPVLDALVQSAARYCGAEDASIFQLNGESLRADAHHGPVPQLAGFRVPVVRGTVGGRTVLERRVIHVADLQAEVEEFPEGSAFARQVGHRTTLSVPLLREGTAIGVIQLRRADVNPFTDKQIALLKTFADQAVIAIENVRLFKELEARNRDLTTALDRQTATSDILRVISSSPTDVQPVFDAIAESSVRLCGALFGAVYRFDGELVHLVAHHNYSPDALAYSVGLFPAPLDRRLFATQAIRERGVVHIRDISSVAADYPSAGHVAQDFGFRSVLVVPMLRGGEPIGAVQVWHADVAPFSEVHISLLQTFADQAVIAIENVRLFTELQDRNRALTEAHTQVSEALERQTATSEILRVISSSPTDVQPVFESLVASAARLCGANDVLLLIRESDVLRPTAGVGSFWESLAADFRVPLVRGSVAARSVIDGATLHVPDLAVLSEADFPVGRDLQRRFGHRTVLAVPLFRERVALGTIFAMRFEVRPFADQQVELLKTFADQAVIAIENARLFKELEERTQELTRSVDQLTALGEVGRAVSSTLDLETVLTTIVSRAVQLSGLDGGVVFEYDDSAEEFVQRVATESSVALGEARRTTRIRRGEGVLGRTAITLEPVQVPDITVPAAYEGRLRETLIAAGIRAILAVPMVREGRLLGCLGVTRNSPGEFPAETVELLRTFATQSALAIQNARLFREIADKSRQLEAASQHKSEFLANMSHELRTPLNAIIGFSEVLAERMFGELNEKQEEYLKDIYASGQHLLSLINDILDLSKIEAGRMELELTDFDLPTAIENALTLVRERAGRRGIALHQAVDQRLGQIRGDERKIKQVLLNLLSNALKFTPEGGRVEVRARVSDGMAEISVADTGVGIAPGDQEAIFEEFRQVGTAAKKVEGTGLGLALSRKFIELHGGRIWVQSQVGVGSTFTFTLPGDLA